MNAHAHNAVSAELDRRNNACAELERLRAEWSEAELARLNSCAEDANYRAVVSRSCSALDALEAHRRWMAKLALDAVRAVLPGITWDQIREIAP